jgi:pyocin large subunit-like protein
MGRHLVRAIVIGSIILFGWIVRQQQSALPLSKFQAATSAADAWATWGRPESLPDHFARHGHDFHARDAADYAAQAHAFLEHAKAAGLPAKRARDGSLRIYEKATDTFGAYNADGTTRTFFKPGSYDYYERQPGEPVDLRSLR